MTAGRDHRILALARRAAALAALGALASPAGAAGRQLLTIWTIDGNAPSGSTFEAAREDYVFKQRLLPSGLVELGPVPAEAAAAAGVSEGQQLVEVKSDVPVYCDANVRAQKLIGHAQPCFVDADSDGRFEGLFLTSSVTKGILTLQGSRPKQPRAIAPIAYRRVEPDAFRQKLFVGLQYRGNANLVGNHIFEIRYGSDEQTGSLTDRILHKKTDIPGSHDMMGGRFTILAATPRGIRVRIDQPIPSQPFSVVQTTTYRFY